MITLLTLLLEPTALATEIGSRPFGLGIQLGTPSGLTGKYYLGSRVSAISFAVGGAYGDVLYDSFFAHATYELHFEELTAGSGVAIPWRIGIGGWLASGDYWVYGPGRDLILGARVPIGLDFDLEEAPVQFYVEVAFSMSVFPGIGAGLDAGLGVRYYF